MIWKLKPRSLRAPVELPVTITARPASRTAAWALSVVYQPSPQITAVALGAEGKGCWKTIE